MLGEGCFSLRVRILVKVLAGAIPRLAGNTPAATLAAYPRRYPWTRHQPADDRVFRAAHVGVTAWSGSATFGPRQCSA